jgi:late competence protein required for DNA uptake (superfamily II DNA/RNA helicase)
MSMQISDRPLAVTNSTLSTLIAELSTECLKVQALVNQLQLPSLTVNQQAEILAELLAATVHLHNHCDEDFQTLIIEEMENFPSDED